MKLPEQDADLFYELMWALQIFVNQKFKILPNVKTLDAYSDLPSAEKMKVRQKLYENIDLIDVFVKKNPQGFSTEKLAIVSKWKQFVSGDFHIERILKKYAIFISTESEVYAVLGLYDEIDEIFYKGQLPILVKAVLLPFKGKIIHDGLLQGYNVLFGGGISSGLKEDYMVAKQNGRIIETLESDSKQALSVSKPGKNWKPELEHLQESAKKLRSSRDQPALYAPIFSLIKASLDLGQSTVSNSKDLDTLWKQFKKAERALKTVETTLRRSE